MIKKLLMAAAVVVMAVPAAAQGSRRSEVSVSYGVAPVTDWIDSYSDMLTGLFTNANTDLKGWGAVTVGYSFRLIGSLRDLRAEARRTPVRRDVDDEPWGDPVGLGMPRRRMTLLGALWHVATWKLRRVGLL